MNPISFMSANFVARQSNYDPNVDTNWMYHDEMTQNYFRPLETYRERIAELLQEVHDAGFQAMDLWLPHLHPLWATLEHIAIFREEAFARKIRVTSLAGFFGSDAITFRASCRLAVEVGAPILGGLTTLLETDRPLMVQILRENGLIFALENHPEKTPGEVLEKLGAGDEDVVGVAVDTGWFGTQGFAPDTAIQEFGDRIALVHLKDVEAVGAHDTCALGQGVARLPECVRALQTLGYQGTISIEHEPFDRNPIPEVIESKHWTEQRLAELPDLEARTRPVGMAILGCGNIAATYAKQLKGYPEVNLKGVFDIDPERTRDFAAAWELSVFGSIEELLSDPEVEVVVNLTIHQAHYETIKRCLEAGKHVHTEKPLATTYEQAAELVKLAEEKGLRLSSAPTTWLGEAQQTMWAHQAAGRIGTPRIAYAEVNWGRIESWHPNPGPFYAVGPVFDVAVYPLALLTAWFGPVRSVCAGGGIIFPHRKTKEGVDFEVTSPDWTCAVLHFESGLMARLTSSFYVATANSQGGLQLHGDLGSLGIEKWDSANSPVSFGLFGKTPARLPVSPSPFQGTEYAKGLRDLALAVREDRPHRCTGAHAAHVVEICEAVLRSVEEGKTLAVRSSFSAPDQLPWAKELAEKL